MMTSENFHRTDILLIMSDFHKDAHGFRPRGIDYTKWSDEDIISEWNSLEKICDANRIENAEQLAQDILTWEDELENLIAIGANNRPTAIRWIVEGIKGDKEYIDGQDLEHYIWNKGILFSDTGRTLYQELLNTLISIQS